MATKVLMPQLGESVTEATVTKWLKQPGETVNEYDALIEVNTDKVDTEIPAPTSGVVLATLAEEGATVKVGTLLAWIGQPGEALPGDSGVEAGESLVEAPPTLDNAPSLHAPAHPSPSQPRDLGFISPVVRRMAAEHNLDLHQISGTGSNRRITRQDVQAYLDSKPTPQPTPAPPSTPAGSTLIPHTSIRRLIAEHMVLSERTSPHVTTVMEVDLSRVTAHRAANKAAFARDGVNLTFTAYFIAATVAALKAYPQVNSSWSEEGLLVHAQINIGMATSLGEEGLIVPVIKAADSLSLLGLARTINDLANRARARKLLPEEVKGGTFTITNHGISGSLFAAPIINQPQAGILGVGAIQKRPVVLSDKALGDVIAIRPMAYLSFTFDHRILDGASADYFLGKVVEYLQNFDKEKA